MFLSFQMGKNPIEKFYFILVQIGLCQLPMGKYSIGNELEILVRVPKKGTHRINITFIRGGLVASSSSAYFVFYRLSIIVFGL